MNMGLSEPRQQSAVTDRLRPQSRRELQGHAETVFLKRADLHQEPERPILFGPFCLFAGQRLLLKGKEPVQLGSRALDILIALVERPGTLISKDELMARVWPNTFVEPANLTVHISTLRRMLGDGVCGNRFLVNTPGRGYRFVAPIKISEELEPPPQPVFVERRHNLPARVTRLIGRENVLAGLSAHLSRERLLSIVGPGGIGKTSVALAAAEQQISNYRHGVWLIDMATIGDALQIPAILASALGLENSAENSLPTLIATLADKQMLLVLDNCEHVVAAAADFAAGILSGTPTVQILATSREPLRTSGERIWQLAALESAPSTTSIKAEEALRFSAIQLFVERTAAAIGEFALSDADAPVVNDICRRLDGIPLAIELAAARVNCFGIRGVAARLNDCLDLLAVRSRTAPPRHQTMRAALDWSYDVLSHAEQTALRRLSVFSDYFTLQTAAAVVSDDNHTSDPIVEQMIELVAKSLVVAETVGTEPRLKLLQTTRAYALAKLTESGEFDAVARRHAKMHQIAAEPNLV